MELREEFCAEIGSTMCYSSEIVSLEGSVVGILAGCLITAVTLDFLQRVPQALVQVPYNETC